VDGVWATNSEGVGLIVREISFQDFRPMWSWSTNVTDGRTTCDRNTALCTKVHRAVKMKSGRRCRRWSGITCYWGNKAVINFTKRLSACVKASGGPDTLFCRTLYNTDKKAELPQR